MPMSQPAYFPPVRGTDQIVGLNAGINQTGARVFLAGQNAGANSTVSDLVVLGSGSLKAGITNADRAGTVVIGSTSLGALVGTAGISGPVTSVGYNNANIATGAAVSFSGIVMLGAGIAANYITGGNFRDSILIGNKAADQIGVANAGGGTIDQCVLIGQEVARGNSAGDPRNLTSSVIIGYRAALNHGTNTGGQITTSVIIGSAAAQTLGATNLADGNVIIGAGAGSGGLTNASNCTLIGTGAGGGTGALTDNTCVGANAGSVLVGGKNTIVGSGITSQQTSRNIFIGYQADNGAPITGSDVLIIGTFDAAIQRTAIYGDMANGNLIVGRSVQGTNRDFRGTTQPTNVLKLLNGTLGTGANPTGGGFFYVAAGALHWFGSAGTDTVVAPA